CRKPAGIGRRCSGQCLHPPPHPSGSDPGTGASRAQPFIDKGAQGAGICRMRSHLGLVSGLFLSACGSVDLPTFPPTDPETIEIRPAMLAGSVLMRRVEGVSCNRSAPHAEALASAKRDAAGIGATAIYRVRYSST